MDPDVLQVQTKDDGSTVLGVFTDDTAKKLTYSLTLTAHFESHGSSNSVQK